jgi:hypothetical protein
VTLESACPSRTFAFFCGLKVFLRGSSLKLQAKMADLACVTTYPVDSMK